MKKFLSLLLVVAMLLPLLCVSAVAEEPVEIKILAQIWAPYKEEQMDIFREIEKACNVKFTIEWAPRDGFNERVYSTLASGQLPDLIARQGLSESSLINEGAIVPLDDYLQYAPNYVAAIGEDKASLTNASDGYLYPISSIIDIQPAYAGVASGMFADHQEAADKCIRLKDEVLPNPQGAAFYQEQFALYKDIQAVLAPVYHKL